MTLRNILLSIPTIAEDREMWEILQDDLLKFRELKVATSFHCDPEISVRAATPEDRLVRNFHSYRDVYEILLVLDGGCEIMIGDRVYSGGEGAALLIEPGIRHESFYPKTAPDGRHLWILCTPNYLILAILLSNWIITVLYYTLGGAFFQEALAAGNAIFRFYFAGNKCTGISEIGTGMGRIYSNPKWGHGKFGFGE